MNLSQIGERVKEIRRERRLSVAQFGKLLGVSSQHIGMVERGSHGLSTRLIVKLCHVTGVSADYILFGTIDVNQCLAITTILNGASSEQIQIILDMVKKTAQFLNTEDGNETLIREVLSQQCYNANNGF